MALARCAHDQHDECRLKDFSVTRTVAVRTTSATKSALLAPADICGGIAHKGRLQEDKFVTAARSLLQSFPALGSSLDVSSVPALKLVPATLQVSFATWPSGKAGLVQGLHALPSTPTLPVYAPLEIAEAARGNSPLFKLRVTALGDGSSLVAASWLHILADGASIARAVQWLSVAYRGTEYAGASLPVRAQLPSVAVRICVTQGDAKGLKAAVSAHSVAQQEWSASRAAAPRHADELLQGHLFQLLFQSKPSQAT
ncbi:hypothetical protein WJX73_000261 [Symbiochloris irregularis]|uniref:Uncharacterized protein n=1 Tax=Symbiochloris irregularis TaxID=706552 RepID=A0AAW1PQJ1_9CHLO